jgi:membrane protein
MTPKNFFALFKQTLTEFGEDKVPRLGAALAYYTIFSIAPLLLIAIAIAGIVLGKEAAQGQLFTQLKGLLGAGAASAIEEMIKNAAKPKAGTIATIVGVVTLLFGASGVFGELHDGLNTIWDVQKKKVSGIFGFIKDRFLSVAMVMGVGFLLLVSLMVDTAVTFLGKWMKDRLPGGETLWQIIELGLSFVVITVMFAMIFRFLPDLKIEWHDVWFGAAFTALLFVLGKFALAFYFGKAAVGSSFGAAGSLVLLLVWIYYSAQILYFGAEFTQVYARSHGSLKSEAKENASQPAQADTAHPPVVPFRPKPAPVPAPASGGGKAKLAAGGIAGLTLGALLGLFGGVMLVVKSVKKVFGIFT